MEKVKRTSLKAEFITAVAVTLLIAAVLTALTEWGCWALRRWLVPRPDELLLSAHYESPGGWSDDFTSAVTVDGAGVRVDVPSRLVKAEDGGERPAPEERPVAAYTFRVLSPEFSVYRNGPRRGAAYIAAGAAMGILPAVYFAAGTVLCALRFYRKKLAPAIAALDDAARHISAQDLDFTVEAPARNELGRLCVSFEEMRQALYDNNLRLWRTMEARRTMQASAAHDLRNPLAILKGTAERLRESARAGTLTPERLESSLTALESAAHRLERYTDNIRDLDALEDTEPALTETALPEFLREAGESMAVLAESRGLSLETEMDVPGCTVLLDREIFYRVLENLLSNAVRYAETGVELCFSLCGEVLTAQVRDDGPGFSDRMLRKRDSLFFTEDPSDGHRGLGLATGRILCRRHGGGLTVANRPSGGALAEMTLSVKRIWIS